MSERRQTPLLKWRDMPNHLQFNPFILHGYRPTQTGWQCLGSLSYLHNETVNVLTHLLPCIFTVLAVPWLIPWHLVTVPILPYLHILALITPWLGSVIYHLFMNHHAGVQLYTRLLQIDMIGIWVTHSVGAFTTLVATVCCLSSPISWSLCGLYVIYCIYSFVQCLKADTVFKRRICFLGMIVIQFTAASLRPRIGGGSGVAYHHYLIQDVWAITGAIIGAVRIPERWFPGTFDTYCNSHHIMHVMVVVAIYHMHEAACHDLIWMTSRLGQSC